MEPAIAGLFPGHETIHVYGWSGTYLVWKLEDFVGVGLRQGPCAVNRQQSIPFIAKELVMVEEGVSYPLKSRMREAQ